MKPPIRELPAASDLAMAEVSVCRSVVPPVAATYFQTLNKMKLQPVDAAALPSAAAAAAFVAVVMLALEVRRNKQEQQFVEPSKGGRP